MAFQIDTSGKVWVHAWGHHAVWSDLTPFAQGYVEAALRDLFKPETRGWKWEPAYNGYFRPDYHPLGAGADWSDYPSDVDADEAWVIDHDCDGPPAFSDLAPETLARIMEDCARMQSALLIAKDEAGGRDAWRAQSGGWRDWGKAARTDFPPYSLHLGDDGKIYLRDASTTVAP